MSLLPLLPKSFPAGYISGTEHFYTMAQIKAYGQSCREQALEEAAKACESAIASIWDYHDDGRKQIGTTVCNNLAAAIRRLK